MARSTPQVPAYKRHKTSGRAFARVGGRFVYFGRHGSEKSRELYARWLAGLRSAGPAAADAPTAVQPAELTVAAVLAAFWAHAKTAYPYDPSYAGRRPPGEIGNLYDAMQPVLKLYASLPAVEFGPRALGLVRDDMVARGWCRNVVNRHVVRVRTMIKWAVAQELLPGEVLHRLQALPGLRRGHKGVRDTAKVRPVPTDVLAATLAHLSPRLAAMVNLQLLTGMRSGNLCQMRTADVERPSDGGAWVYRPRKHKTEHHGHALEIRLGPKAQLVLNVYLKPDEPEVYVFSPAAELADHRAARTAARTTPASCGNTVGSKPAKRAPKWVPRDHYTPGTYAQAINRACDRADRAAREAACTGVPDAETPASRLVPRWNPHRLRHNRGTVVRATHGTDGVLAALGQRTSAMADRYAEIEADKAERIAAELG